MSYNIAWHDEERTIIVCTAIERINYKEMNDAFNEVVALADQTNKPFYFIFDLEQIKRVEPLNIREMQRLGQHPYTKHPNRAKTYIAALNPRVRMIVDAFNRLFPRYANNLATANNLEHALTLIAAEKQKAASTS